MAIDFPNSPTTGQQFTASGRTWTYNGSVWVLLTTNETLSTDYNAAFLFGGM